MRAMWLAVAVAGAGLVTACKDSQKPDENAGPSADFSFQCSALRCDFHDASSDDEGVVSWTWNFGPGGSTQRNPFYLYSSAGTYDVSLSVTDAQGLTSTSTKKVNPKNPVVTQLSCVDGSAPGGFVACTLKLEQQAGFKVVLNSSSCQAHGNVFRTTIPISGTLTDDGCYEQAGKQLTFLGPFEAGTEISAEVVAPLLANPPRLRVDGAYPVWTLTYEDGADADFDDMNLTLTALPTGN
ncbi:MAG TPA: PKD domain-containing protein [Gemmatimonadales bacterium]|nr:PKD domain-containing protein [Gemmatimonadales bacterium]